MGDWITSLQTDTPQQGFELREVYARSANSLIMDFHVVANYFQTVAAANNYWK
ncbi:hexameric tyrosine-coordinated heme protein [Sporosarcina sp. FA9]|uniref:hexameric tyrosine-coordinated heme protein n=1 Tax=Sporosarcina sp. FA9 TaxID=3413030 RepID=UPI003F65C346